MLSTIAVYNSNTKELGCGLLIAKSQVHALLATVRKRMDAKLNAVVAEVIQKLENEAVDKFWDYSMVGSTEVVESVTKALEAEGIMLVIDELGADSIELMLKHIQTRS